jgi:hypothetical protein
MPWQGTVWLNPPYSIKLLSEFMNKIAEHNHGTALIFAKTETQMFFECVWSKAAAVLFVRHRLHFHDRDGNIATFNGGAGSVLVAYGQDDMDILATQPIEGKFIPLKLQGSWLIGFTQRQSWRKELEAFFEAKDGPVDLHEIYQAFDGHRKAEGNAHVKEKLRQTLGRGNRFVNVGRGRWALAEAA